jgi:hypothetical protein
MYPLRLVVDANCLNAKGRLPAMNELQRYHDIGAIELIVTSTLPAEVDRGSSQAAKAKTYQSIGGQMFSIQGVPGMQSMHGATLRPSRMQLLHTKLFGYGLKGHTLTRAIRDCLHVDQAQMNAADVLVTNDKRLHRAQEILRSEDVLLFVTSPERALVMVKEHFRDSIGTDDLQSTKMHVESLGPIILGSNSVGNCSLTTGASEQTLLSFRIDNGLLQIAGNLRDENGEVAIVLRPGTSPEFPLHKASLTQVGRGPLLASREPFGSFVVNLGDRPILAVRTSHTLRAVVFAMELRDETGRVVASVEREKLTLQGANLHFH